MSAFECIKTGCHILLVEYDEYAYGDAFQMVVDGGPGNLSFVYFFRLCERSHKPIRDVLHFTVHEITHWFDDEHTGQAQNSTLIAESVTNLGYDGEPLEHGVGGTG